MVGEGVVCRRSNFEPRTSNKKWVGWWDDPLQQTRSEQVGILLLTSAKVPFSWQRFLGRSRCRFLPFLVLDIPKFLNIALQELAYFSSLSYHILQILLHFYHQLLYQGIKPSLLQRSSSCSLFNKALSAYNCCIFSSPSCLPSFLFSSTTSHNFFRRALSSTHHHHML